MVAHSSPLLVTVIGSPAANWSGWSEDGNGSTVGSAVGGVVTSGVGVLTVGAGVAGACALIVAVGALVARAWLSSVFRAGATSAPATASRTTAPIASLTGLAS